MNPTILALSLCVFPVRWSGVDICLEQTPQVVTRDLEKMTALLESDVARESQSDLPIYFQDKGGFVSKKKLKKSLKAMSAFMKEARYQDFLMVNRSLELNYAPMIPYHYPVNEEISKYFRLKKHPEEAQGTADAETSFPSLKSSVKDSASLDLKLGFNRRPEDIPTGKNCKYKEAKTNYGTHPGFTLNCNKQETKIKFGEYHSEPFGSRIFWALGYNVDPVDYLPNVTLPYDRRIFTEFNSRRLMVTRFQIGHHLTKELPISLRNNPFKFIQSVELKDGTLVSGRKLKKFLIGKNKAKEINEKMIIKENEDQIVKVHTGPVQIQVEGEETNFGPFTWDEFKIEKSKEARELLILAAWLNWFDCRMDNNRLRLIEANKKLTLMHVISDLGGMLGKSSGNIPFMNSVEVLKDFETHFLELGKDGGISFPHYRPILSNEAFNHATVEDMKPLALKILELTPEQITTALEASGFTSKEVAGFKEKLLHRQQEIREVFDPTVP